MAIVSLLRLPLRSEPRERWAFVFEHDQRHRKASTVTSYLLDPMQNERWPGTKWHLDHQQAHRVMAAGNPSGTPPVSPTFGAILADSNLLNSRQRKWWEFLNHREHFIHQ